MFIIYLEMFECVCFLFFVSVPPYVCACVCISSSMYVCMYYIYVCIVCFVLYCMYVCIYVCVCVCVWLYALALAHSTQSTKYDIRSFSVTRNTIFHWQSHKEFNSKYTMWKSYKLNNSQIYSCKNKMFVNYWKSMEECRCYVDRKH